MSPSDRPGPFEVDWSNLATYGFADATAAYFAAGLGGRVVTAERTAMELLADDPLRNGRRLPEGLYQVTVSPLVFSYEVRLDGRRVVIAAVRYFPPPTSGA